MLNLRDWSLSSINGSGGTLYVTMADLAKEIFRDQVERVVFITADLKIYILNSGEIERIAGPDSRVCEYLKEQGIKISNIALIVHNHFTPRRFTFRDTQTYHYFRNQGFRGLFAIYYPATGTVRVKEDE